jgi:hypothetical protein
MVDAGETLALRDSRCSGTGGFFVVRKALRHKLSIFRAWMPAGVVVYLP